MQRNRLDADRARTDTRDWAKARRERTPHLIELGGLVIKADLVELLDDDRATLLGALLDIAGRLQQQDDERQEGRTETPADLKARWRRQGIRAFDTDNTAAAEWDSGAGNSQVGPSMPLVLNPGQPSPTRG